ncbi:hypothetical protein BJ165DRAFT_1534489 [Panaeolus papilionaceus]|nr:hypothetical protein BJ165DRAFT_1534489 [Panaeolus papilionaceus]
MSSELRVSGSTSIERRDRLHIRSCKILILGPTGSGKSTFVEALAGKDQDLGLSNDQLDAVTQEVKAYELQQAVYVFGLDDEDPWPIYMIDTPGFLDVRKSSMEIIDQVQSYTDRLGISKNIDHILYLCPVNANRVPGTERKVIKMLKELLKSDDASQLTIVSTMWDRLWSARSKERAEVHAAQLENDIWKELVDKGAKVMKYEGDVSGSALQIVRAAVQRVTGGTALSNSQIATCAPLFYQDLMDRIHNGRQERRTLLADKNGLYANPNENLEAHVVTKLNNLEGDLAKFRRQIAAFRDPPPNFKEAPRQLAFQSLLDCVNDTKREAKALHSALTQLPEKRDLIWESMLREALNEVASGVSRRIQGLRDYGNPPLGLSSALKPALLPLELAPVFTQPATEASLSQAPDIASAEGKPECLVEVIANMNLTTATSNDEEASFVTPAKGGLLRWISDRFRGPKNAYIKLKTAITLPFKGTSPRS